MKKFKDWIKNSDNIIYCIIFLVAGIIFCVELMNLKSVIESVKDSFRFDGFFAGFFATFGCFLPPSILTLDGSWIYRSWKNWKW